MKRAYLQMHLAIFLWGFTGLLGKLISLNEGMLVWYRMLISWICFALIVLPGKGWPRLKRSEWLGISGIGILVMLHWLTFYGSIKLSSISVAMICLSSIALFSSFIEPLVNRQRFDYFEILFSAMGLGGIFTIYRSDSSASAGIIIGLISAVLSATFSVFNRRIASRYDPSLISFIELGSGWIFLSLLLPLYFRVQPTTGFLPGAMDWIYLLLLSVVCTVLTWILSLKALQKVSAYTMALALNLEPVYGIILAVLFANEGKILNGGFYFGAVIILLTVVLHTVYRYRKTKRLASQGN
jgi:drug/metabolite transporter (DMT)-like permease